MEHLAIDIGGRESQICLRSPSGEITQEKKVRTQDLPKLFASLPPSRVVFETCGESFWIADAVVRAGHEVRVVASTLVRSLGVGSRGVKNDCKDARVLSEVSCRIDLPSIYVPDTESRDHKSMLSMRDVLVHSRTAMINAVRGWMRGRAVRVRTGVTDTFAQRLRAACGETLPTAIARLLDTIEHLCQQIDAADKELQAIAKADDVCRRLKSVPGVGSLIAVAYKSTLDTTKRFESAHHVQSYVGLTPGEYASSEKHRRTGITKAGSTRLRWLLVQAAWTARRCAPNDPMVLWSKEVEKRRGKRVAVVALARKIAGILFAIWRDGMLYSPLENAPRLEATAA